METQKQIETILKSCRADPVKFFVEVLGVPAGFIWDKMVEVCASVRDNKFTAVKAGHSVSKSFSAARLALWFLYCFPPSTVITTAPCFDDKTEVLTEAGWKLLKDVSLGEKIAQFNDDESISFVYPKALHKSFFSGELIGYKSHLCDFLVTPNHRCVIRRTNGKIAVKTAGDIYGKSSLYFPKVFKNGQAIDISLDFMEFLGFWYAEGWAEHNPKARKYRVILTQKNEKEYAEDLLRRNGFEYSTEYATGGIGYERGEKNGCNIYTIYSKELTTRMLPYIGKKSYEKELPLSFWMMDKEHAAAFLHGYFMGDGGEDENGSIKYYTSSKKLANAIQFLINTTGNAATIATRKPTGQYSKRDCYIVGEWRKRGKNIQWKKQAWYKERYDGLVYCPEVESGKIVVRRNNNIIVSGNSNTQVEDILWREIRDAHAKAPYFLGGKVTNTQLDLGEKWFALGFSTRPDTVTQQATRFQGFHNSSVLVIFDEAAGIERPIWEAKDSLLTSGHVRFLAIGNPTAATGDFVNCFKDSGFHKITISVFDTPNYKAGTDVIPGVSGREYVADIERKYGRTSNYFKARVLGEIPSEDADALIPLSWIEKAEKRDPYPFPFTRKYLTWDVADGGEDAHEIKAWENLTEVDSLTLRQKTVEEAEPYVWRELRKADASAIIVDADGIGRVAIGLLNAAKDKDISIIPFEGSSVEVRDCSAFSHRYSEGHWAMRKAFEENKISIGLDPECREDISGVRLDNLTNRHSPHIVVEKKKFLKERLGRSPGKKDCVMMACAEWDRVPFSEKKQDRYRQREPEYALNPNLA